MENVKPGRYSLRANISGFAETVMNGIAVEARQDVRLTVVLTVAAQTSTVEVTAGADQINSENAAIGDSKDNQQITQLPLNNRATTTSPLGALSLSPNVQQDSQGKITGPPNDPPNVLNFFGALPENPYGLASSA